jgi:hypothetical protein
MMSPLGKVQGVKNQVLTASKSQANPKLGIPLRVIAETWEGALDFLLDEKPELILIYAKVTLVKETQGSSFRIHV